MSEQPNAAMVAAWDGDEGEHWARNEDRYNEGAAPPWQEFLTRVDLAGHERILDVGCGTGLTTRDLARRVPGGHAHGVDLSHAMLDVARRRAEEDGLTNVTYEQADAQVHAFEPASFDLVTSRFGVMFFDDPVAAFSNIGGATRPGGHLALLVWRRLDENEWGWAVRSALLAGREMPVPPPTAPSPWSLADPDRVHDILEGAGWRDVAFDPVDVQLRYGVDADEAFRFFSGLGFVRMMLTDLDDDAAKGALDTLRATVDAHDGPDGVTFAGACWVITATR